MGRTVLVTGATGMLGSHLIPKLVSRGDKVLCYQRAGSSLEKVAQLGAESVFDLEWAGEVDAVYYCAGQLGKRGVHINAYQAVHAVLPKIILSLMRPGHKFVYVSSAYVEYLKKAYEVTKLEGEITVQGFGNSKDIDWTVIRPGVMYGERDMHHLMIYKLVKALGRYFPIVGDGKNVMSPVYAGDVADAILKAGERSNLGNRQTITVAGELITMIEWLGRIADCLDVERPTGEVKLPDWKWRLYRDVVRADFWTQSRPFKSTTPAATKMTEGLQKTVTWYQENNLL